MKVKVLGAGSIGNHMSQASRSLGWSVTLCDTDAAALERTKNSIYPGRYGRWDDDIELRLADEAPVGGFDLIIIGTPPDSHMALALAALEEAPRGILVEKPLCGPDLTGAQDLFEKARAAGVEVFVGYDHVVGRAACTAVESTSGGRIGDIKTLDVEFREYWGGIFAAHPWLDGPWDSYLGYWQRGGGASGEHSHATNLWQHFAHALGVGRVVEVAATLDYIRDGRVDYDSLCLLNLRTEGGMVGRVVQDVVTTPPRKWARIQGSNGFVEWHCGFEPGCDAVIEKRGDGEPSTTKIIKTRPDDFIQELGHIQAYMNGVERQPDITLERGLDTMMVVAAAHLSNREGRVVRIDYAKGYSPDALSLS
jgi:predicted dehydrogenase